MKTHELISMLAQGAGPAARAPVARRFGLALALGLVLALAAALLTKGPIAAPMLALPAPWIKLGYAGALAVAALWWLARLARPGASGAAALRTVVALVAAMLALGLAMLAAQPAGARLEAVLGASWASCMSSVLALSLPTLGASFWALRGLAPTRLRLAGFAAGLLAGSVGAFAYSLACPESSPVFIALWYTVGIGLCAGLGAALGARALGW